LLAGGNRQMDSDQRYGINQPAVIAEVIDGTLT
jgi:hypothetical protein